MNTNAPPETAAASPKPYKRLLIEAKSLQTTAKANVFKRVKLLVKVFDDQEFRADHGADDFVLSGILDQYVADIGWGFMELRSILDHFPTEREWKSGRLSKMHDAVLQERRKRQAEEPKPSRRKSQPISRAEADAIRNQNRELRAKYQAAMSRGIERQEDKQHAEETPPGEVQNLRSRLAAAQKRIEELERENAQLKRRLAELGQLVAA